MSLSTSTLRRLGAMLTVTAAVAGVAAPATLANHHQDLGVETALKVIRGTAGAPDLIDRYLRSHPQAPTGVDCDAICRYLGNHERGINLSTDTLGGKGGAPLPAVAPSSRSSWPAAGLAAAVASGALVLIAATMVVLRRRRSSLAT